MQLRIDLDSIEDSNKTIWLLDALKLMDIEFYLVERRQTLGEYNDELEARDTEIERGEYITAEELKARMGKWK